MDSFDYLQDKENLVKKQKLVEQGMAAIQQDITEFQREKQGRLNQIDVIVSLRMHQIEFLVDGRLPADLSQVKDDLVGLSLKASQSLAAP